MQMQMHHYRLLQENLHLLLLNHQLRVHLHLQKFTLLIHQNLVICQSLCLLEHIREDVLLRPGEVTHWVNLMLPKTKLKPFFWDKVLANPDHSMVWLEIKAGSFQFNEEMMDSLFGYIPGDQGKDDRRKVSSSFDQTSQYIQIIDPKRSQNLAILLEALNVT